MKVVTALAAACFVAALPLLLVTTNIRILAGDVGFYRRALRAHDAPQATGIALPELDRSAQEIVDYFENDASTLRIVVVQDGSETSLFNSRETEHMHDVKRLVRAIFRVHEISLAFVLAYAGGTVLWTRERSVRELAVLSLAGVAVLFVAVAAVGTLALSGFDEAWNRFHEIAFTNDLWQLDPDTDHLIQMFPEPFWEEATYLAAIMTLGEVVLVAGLAGGYLVLRPGPRTGRGAVRQDTTVRPPRRPAA